MFLRVKKMPKLFRFTAADFASRDAPIETEESVWSENLRRRILSRTIVSHTDNPIDPADTILGKNSSFDGPPCSHVENIISALCSLIIFIAVTVSGRARLSQDRILNVGSCENRHAVGPRRNQNRISVFSRPRPRLRLSGDATIVLQVFCVPF